MFKKVARELFWSRKRGGKKEGEKVSPRRLPWARTNLGEMKVRRQEGDIFFLQRKTHEESTSQEQTNILHGGKKAKGGEVEEGRVELVLKLSTCMRYELKAEGKLGVIRLRENIVGRPGG